MTRLLEIKEQLGVNEITIDVESDMNGPEYGFTVSIADTFESKEDAEYVATCIKKLFERQ